MFSFLSKKLHPFVYFATPIIIAGVISFELLAQNREGKPDTNVKVVDFLPQDQTNRETNITIKFSNDLVIADSLDKIIPEPPLEIRPQIPGIARWIETDVIRFYPDRPLLPATEYTVKVHSSDTYINGNRINDNRAFTFRTQPFKVVSLNWEPLFDETEPGLIRLSISIEFNYKAELKQLKDKLSIKGERGAIKSSLSYKIENIQSEPRQTRLDEMEWQKPKGQFADFVTLTTEPFKTTEEDQIYKLIIKRKLDCEDCGEPLENDYEKDIIIKKYRRFVVSELRGGVEGKNGVMYLRLSTSVAADYVKDYLTIKSQNDSAMTDFRIENYRHLLIIRGDFYSGQTYEVTLSRGTPAFDGAVLENEFSSKIKIPDLPPSLKFVSPGIYLPKEGAGNLELETINVDSLTIEVEQIFANNLVYAMTGNMATVWRYGQPPMSSVGRQFYSQSMDLEGRLNEPLITTVDIGRIIGDSARGLFKVSARKKERRWEFDTRLVMLTDIGLLARMSNDYLMVWVNSLSETKPIYKADVKLFSRNNQLLLEGSTDSRGIVVFDNIAKKIEGFEPYLITVEKETDLSFLKFDECLLPTSEFDIKGRPYLGKGYEAFLYLDRDIFRPGDTAHIVSIVRGTNGSMPPEFPYFLTVKDPSGNEFKSFRVKTSAEGLLSVALPVPDYSRTGKYSITARIGEDYEIGRIGFQVEEFMPDKIKTTVTTARDIYMAGDSIEIDVNGKYLFGPPAARHKVTGHLTIEAHPFTATNMSDYSFTDYERKFPPMDINLGDNLLDDSGYFRFNYKVPANLTPPSGLKGLISAGVSEEGGRVINAYKEITIHAYDRYVGIKLNFDGYARPGEPFEAALIAVDNESQPVEIKSIRVDFYRQVYHSILRQEQNGRYRYVSEKKLVFVDSAITNLPDSGATVSFTPPEYGSYKLVVTDTEGGHSAAVTFYASGWGYSPWSMEKPDRIDIDFDKSTYKPGENAVVQIRAPFGGTLLLTIEKETILDFITYQMDENTAELTLPVKKDYFPNAYVSAVIIKKSANVDKTSPARAYGVAPLKLSYNEKDLDLNINAPEIVKPGQKVKINVQLDKKGISEVTVAVVDAGILQLTDYQTPNPLSFFYGQRYLLLKPYDVYSFLYPEVEQAASHLSPAGGRADILEASRRRHLNPIKARRVKPVSLWSGIVKTDENGFAVVDFNLPEFNGKLIISAVAVQGNLFGADDFEMIVRDKIIIQESFPRFTAPNDIINGLVTIFNNTGKDNDILVNLDCDGPINIISEATQKIHLADSREGNIIFKLNTTVVPGVIHIKLTANDGIDSSHLIFELPNRPIQPLVTKYESGIVNKDLAAFFALPGDWIVNTDQYIIQTSGLSTVGFKRNIDYLLRYPYGCLEQTTSRVFPMLYYNDLLRFADPDLVGSRGGDYFIQEGITKLLGMMRDDGSFSFWPGRDQVHYWSSIYASHFLLEAQKAGYYVNEMACKKILGSLNQIAEGKVKEAGTPERIYAAYVLAGSGKLKKKTINYLQEIWRGDLQPFSRYQVAGALALSGDRETAMSIIPTDIQPAIFEPETGGTFSSGVRTNAILLDVLNEIDPENPSCAVLARELMDGARTGRWYTTQENAFGLMALSKYLSRQSNLDFDGTIIIGNDSTYHIDANDFRLIKKNLAGQNVQIMVEGEGTCFYYWQASGVPTDNAPKEFTRGIDITREYLDANGNAIDLQNINLGDQIICHIKARSIDRFLQNVVINDLLPAGLEIENPRLRTTPMLSWIPQPGKDIDYQDIRDDRLLLFSNLNTKKPVEFYYSLRAISSGEFKIPPIAAECMYNPVIAGASSSGFMIIK